VFHVYIRTDEVAGVDKGIFQRTCNAKKVAIYGADFSANFGDVFLHFPALLKQKTFVT
jgi:hypothetical protein